MIDEIQERLAQVRERMSRAAHGAGRRFEEITLISVSKTFDADTVQAAVDAGALALGENRVQEGAEKAKRVTAPGLEWHLIGHLQANKARLAVQTFAVIHTIDSVELARRLDRIAGGEKRRPVVLLQVDLGQEPTQSGADEALVPEIWRALDDCRNLQFKGLMPLPPFFDDAEPTRPYF